MLKREFGVALIISLSVWIGACTKEEEPPAPLFENLGSHHHAVTTSSEMAQKYFDQGLRLLYGFNHDEAERAFREAGPDRSELRDGMVGAGRTLLVPTT